jgi:MFS family permease
MAVSTVRAPTVRSVLAAPHVGRLLATSILARVPVAALGVVVILRTRELTGSYTAGGAAAAAAALATGLSQPLLARLVDRIGQARVLLPGAVVAAAALTAFARSEDRTRAILAGYQMHLSKPIDPGELLATVASLARRSSRPS